MPVIMLIRVDFPLPDLPMMLVNSPRSKPRVIFLSAVNSPAGDLKVLTTFFSSMNGPLAGRLAGGSWLMLNSPPRAPAAR